MSYYFINKELDREPGLFARCLTLFYSGNILNGHHFYLTMQSDWWHKFIDTTHDVELKRRTYVFLMASYVGSLIIIMLGIKDLSVGDNQLLVILFGSAGAILLNALYYHRTKNIAFCAAFGTLLVCLFTIFLVLNGGYKNTALYWVFPFPMVIYILMGYKAGLLILFVLYSIFGFLLFEPDLAADLYRQEEKTRFLASLFTIVVIGFIGEYFRTRSHEELSHLNVEKQKLANTDSLTGLPNRRFLESVYYPQISQHASDYLPMSIVMTDIDYFKKINDNYGHDFGDKVLQKVAEIFRSSLRKTDLAARTGGEEFVIFLPNAQLSQGIKIAEKVRKAIEQATFEFDSNAVKVTSSFGVATALNEDEIKQGVSQADERLYEAKGAGRNRVM